MMRSLAAQRRVLKTLEPQLRALREQFEQAVATEQARVEAEGAAAAKADDLDVEDLTVDPSAKMTSAPAAGQPDAKADAKPRVVADPTGAKPAGMGVTAEAAAKNEEELIAQTRALFETKGESQSARSLGTASTKPTPDNDDDLYDF